MSTGIHWKGATATWVRLSGNGIGYAARVRGTSEEPAYLRFWRSEDGGKTWQRPIRISEPSRYLVQALHNVITRTSSGRLILPVYSKMLHPPDPRRESLVLGGLLRNRWINTAAHHLDSDFTWSFVYFSDDDGRTWKSSPSEVFIWSEDNTAYYRTNEPTVAEVEPGKLLMFMRTTMGQRYKSWSFDDGETWSPPTPTPLAASNAPAQLRTIPATGHLLVVWTQVSEEEIRRGLVRARLSSAVSRTNGAIWEFFQNVESALEGARVEPRPLRFARPEGLTTGPTDPAPIRNPRYVMDLPENYCRCSYPSVFFYRDRVLIGHSNAHYDEHGNYLIPGRLRVLPVSWLYGGAQNMKPLEWPGKGDMKGRFPIH